MKGLYSHSNYTHCILGNFRYGGDHIDNFFVITDFTLKEYEIITFIYNRNTYRLDLVWFFFGGGIEFSKLSDLALQSLEYNRV